MYQNFYNFIQKPFDVTPDPRFLYMSRNHSETLAALIYGIRERRGFITIIGEVGTGKTTLLNATLEKLDDQTASAFIFNTDVTFEELLQMALIDFGLATAEESLPKFVALDRLNRFATAQFAAGKNIVIIIDEAQNLDLQTMENLRLLSNLETPRYKLVQIILSGQPELDEKLRRPEMRQLSQRINLRRYITPLDKKDTFNYIRHHLKIAGCADINFFDKSSLEIIWTYSGGVPRKINILCDNTLLIGYGLGRKKITRSETQEAIRDLSWSPFLHTAAKPDEVKQIKEKQTARFLIPRVAVATAGLSLALILGAMGAALWDSGSEKLESIPAFSKHLWATDSGPPSPGTTPQPENMQSDIQNLNSQETSSKPKPQAPRLTPENLPPAMTPVNQSSEIHPPDSAAIPQDANHEVETQKAVQTATRKRSVENPAPTLKVEASEPDIAESFNQVVVKKGDTLSWIIKESYKDSEEMLPLVLQANTQIQNPDLILPGWVIRLPKHVPTGKLAGRMTENNQSIKWKITTPSTEQ
ncbi:MAG: hypothetical protein C4518_00345 [Desulfobacteraceae bacterium]|nr:MAG: hypothetical protein C4518_00345 [Desulfobacteraceae bacterium]